MNNCVKFDGIFSLKPENDNKDEYKNFFYKFQISSNLSAVISVAIVSAVSFFFYFFR